MRLEGRVNGVGNYFVSILVHAMVRTLPPSLSPHSTTRIVNGLFGSSSLVHLEKERRL